VIVSDDDGRSFHDGGCVPDFIGGSEAQVAELRDGSILLASRLYGDQKHNPPNGCRHFSLSSDQGEPHDLSLARASYRALAGRRELLSSLPAQRHCRPMPPRS